MASGWCINLLRCQRTLRRLTAQAYELVGGVYSGDQLSWSSGDMHAMYWYNQSQHRCYCVQIADDSCWVVVRKAEGPSLYKPDENILVHIVKSPRSDINYYTKKHFLLQSMIFFGNFISFKWFCCIPRLFTTF